MMKTIKSTVRVSYESPCSEMIDLAVTSAIMTGSTPEGYGDPGKAGQNGTYTSYDAWSF